MGTEVGTAVAVGPGVEVGEITGATVAGKAVATGGGEVAARGGTVATGAAESEPHAESANDAATTAIPIPIDLSFLLISPNMPPRTNQNFVPDVFG